MSAASSRNSDTSITKPTEDTDNKSTAVNNQSETLKTTSVMTLDIPAINSSSNKSPRQGSKSSRKKTSKFFQKLKSGAKKGSKKGSSSARPKISKTLHDIKVQVKNPDGTTNEGHKSKGHGLSAEE